MGQVGGSGGRGTDPFGAILGERLESMREKRRAQLGLDVYAAKKNMDLDVHDEFTKRHVDTINNLPGDVEAYGTTPLGGMTVRRAKKQAGTSSMAGASKPTNVPAPPVNTPQGPTAPSTFPNIPGIGTTPTGAAPTANAPAVGVTPAPAAPAKPRRKTRPVSQPVPRRAR